MIFGTDAMCKSVNLQEVTYGDHTIKRVTKGKYLGMILDPAVNFKYHVEHIKAKTLGKISLLGGICPYIGRTTALMLYQTLILPIFDYGDVLYDCLSINDAKTLQTLQNMALKFIRGVPELTSTAYINSELNMTQLNVRRQHHCATQMMKVNMNLCPEPVQRLLVRRGDVSNRNTRHINQGH